MILELAEIKESRTIEADTVCEPIAFANESRMTIPTEDDTPAVNAENEVIYVLEEEAAELICCLKWGHCTLPLLQRHMGAMPISLLPLEEE